MNQRTIDPAETAEVFRGVREQAGGQNLDADLGGIADAVIQFVQVESFTTFMVEYALTDGDIVVHFFPPREAYVAALTNGEPRVDPEYLRYWKLTFPQVLSPVAESYFKTTYPTVQATYVDEMTSWWLRAGGFATRMDPAGFIMRFFEALDRALDAA